MSQKFTISDLLACEVFDSRGMPTVACRVDLGEGGSGFMQVPSGASTGQFEAFELRDGQSGRFAGKGVRKAIDAIEVLIKPALKDRSFTSLAELDGLLCQLDGTDQKKQLGANALLAVSGAFARACASFCQEPLYRFFSADACQLPVPMMNVINGGRHAQNSIAIQEFMIVPFGFSSFSDALQASFEVTASLDSMLKAGGFSRARGDEGGFAPSMKDPREVLDFLTLAIQQSGLGHDQVAIALDMAASEYCNQDGYFLDKAGDCIYDKQQWVSFIDSLVDAYPIVSIEDPASDDDNESWSQLTKLLGDRVQLVGDDVFVTQKSRLEAGVAGNMANAILIKPNQVGTVTETLETICCAREHGYATVVSHRSGETEDAIISDICVGFSCQQIKAGPLRQSDRVSKYNRLLWIEKELGGQACFSNKVYQQYQRVLSDG